MGNVFWRLSNGGWKYFWDLSMAGEDTEVGLVKVDFRQVDDVV